MLVQVCSRKDARQPVGSVKTRYAWVLRLMPVNEVARGGHEVLRWAPANSSAGTAKERADKNKRRGSQQYLLGKSNRDK